MTSTASVGPSLGPVFKFRSSASAVFAEYIVCVCPPLCMGDFPKMLYMYCSWASTQLKVAERSVMIELVRFNLQRFHYKRIPLAMRFNLQCVYSTSNVII